MRLPACSLALALVAVACSAPTDRVTAPSNEPAPPVSAKRDSVARFVVLDGDLYSTWTEGMTLPPYRIAVAADNTMPAVGAVISIRTVRGGGEVTPRRVVVGDDGLITGLTWTLGDTPGVHLLELAAEKGRVDTLAVFARPDAPAHPGDGVYQLFQQSGAQLPSKTSGVVNGLWTVGATLTGAVLDIVDQRFTLRYQFLTTAPASLAGEVIETADGALTLVTVSASGTRTVVARGERAVNNVLTLQSSGIGGPWFATGTQVFAHIAPW